MNIHPTFDQILDEATNHILDHHVSIGNSSAIPAIPLPSPNGSGTFVKFRIEAGTVYGILTAAHVARRLKLGRNSYGQFLGLSKLQKGQTIACSVTFCFIECVAPAEHFHTNSDDAYRPDIAFIALGLNGFPNHELIENSKFYDLDSNQAFWFIEDSHIFSAFFRGACPDSEISEDGYMNTPLCIGGGETIRRDAKTDYWLIPNTSMKSIAGGSGAGFWRFRYKEETLRKSLEGVIIAESPSYESIQAMGPVFLYDDFLPKLKHFCTENFSWFT